MKAITKQAAIDLMKNGARIEDVGHYHNGRWTGKLRAIMPNGNAYKVRQDTLSSILKTEDIQKHPSGGQMVFTLN